MNIAVKCGEDYDYDNVEGFTKIEEIEWENESYQFAITGLWTRDSDGTLWMAHDSGCSCPSPWENLNELERVFSIDQLEAIYKEKSGPDAYGHVVYDEWVAFKATAEKALAALK